MRRDDEILLSKAVQALKADEPDAAQISASAQRVAVRIGLDAILDSVVDLGDVAIEDCKDVRRLLGSYRAGTLSKTRSLMIEAHLHDCGSCFRHAQSESGTATLDWSAPKAARVPAWHLRRYSWALAPVCVLLVTAFFVYRAYWQVPPGVRAEVQSINGSVYRISDTGDRLLKPGDKLAEGDQLRTGGGAHTVLRLSDGSTVEVNERSVLGVGARGHNMTIALDNGAVIVQAAKRDSGHLYVKTPDCRVAVTGTVFSVNSGIKGSRVGVLEGSVHVMHAGVDSFIHAGEEVATNDNMSPTPVEQQVSWSQDRDKYLALLAQFSILQHRLEAIPYPRLRYTSDLLDRVPAETLLYVSIPNAGDYLSEANKIFQEQLKQSPALQEWWNRGHAANSANLDTMVERLHQMSQYLGDEVVLVGVRQANAPGFALVADVRKSGLGDFLRTQLPVSASTSGLTVLDENALNTVVSSQTRSGGYAVIGQRQAIFSNNLAILKQVDAQLNAGASGFAGGAFGQQITAAYNRGAGVILAADLHQMLTSQSKLLHAGHSNEMAINSSGIEDVRYLIAEHREVNGVPENHLNLQFSGTRQRVASWLAAPAPIGSLDYVTPNAALAVAMLSKDPKAIADDILDMALSSDAQKNNLAETEAKLQINFRDDLAGNLGGEFLLAFDGPVLPTPSWKAVIEVRDPERLENTLERLTQSISNLDHEKGAHSIIIQQSVVGEQHFYAVQDQTQGRIIAQYTFSDGYMILAPNRVLLIEALRTKASGVSLSHAATFKASLPRDGNENYSAIAYQNLSPVLAPLLSHLSGETAATIQQLAADARPTTICAWGKDTRIEAASDSHLFGFDFLTLGTLIHTGNKQVAANVRE
ncbi:FecR domain-containing protein [Acidicapsa dinghuensis]|uniref:FecR domain-containing protein n=1 Tax=Acidicapsa dinghuensis TaxID=2218256 RepID=A0ABW1EGF3_9BACT|nr:FecR domain-containing protein [Acidicapsa dinghuensis]